MAQLLKYGIGLGQSQDTDSSPENLLKEAEVRILPTRSLSSLTSSQRLVAELKLIQSTPP